MSNNLPDVSYKTQIFYQNGFWIKPQGITMVYITVIGGGAGGGSGSSSALGVIGTGGGGGGGGANVRVLLPADLVHDSLRITVGLGGGGGTVPAGNGLNGGTTLVQGYYRNDSTGNYIVARALGGNGGISAGTGGSGGGVNAETDAPYIKLSTSFGQAGPSSVSNPTGGVAGPSITYGTTSAQPTTGGACGGGKNTSNVGFSGGSVFGAGIVSTIDGGAAEGGNGQNGSTSIAPFYQLGGSGGGGSGTGTGGTGGNGAIGCGGGGGGAGVTGGPGGAGGNGIVIINCW